MVTRLLLFVVLLLPNFVSCSDAVDFLYNGFRGANLTLDGTAAVTSDGLLRLTNATMPEKSHAFYPDPVRFKINRSSGGASSFSSTFVFGIVPEFSGLMSGHGIALVLSPTQDFHTAIGSQYMGLFNLSSNGKPFNHVVAVELDTVQNPEFSDINANHVGVDIDGMSSITSQRAGYYVNGELQNLNLTSGNSFQAWVEYDGESNQLNVTIAPMGMIKPATPLLSRAINLSRVIFEHMYVGFSSSSDTFRTIHYIQGWSFMTNGTARELDLASLPRLPRRRRKKNPIALVIGLPAGALVAVLAMASALVVVLRRRARFSQMLEDWELAYGPQRFQYRDLYKATQGFRDAEVLGAGGSGTVYRGVLASSKEEVAIKRVCHGSRQGMRAFVAEVACLGRVRHRNLVRLLGYCRREGEFLLVYDFMPNGSLDKFLFDRRSSTLGWSCRFGIIRGVASGLLYLHEEWEQVVIHRDVKASNVLLDGDFNGRLGDFGLARLYDRGTDPQTTHVVGTMGYLAPEIPRTGKSTKATDVFAFGVFLLEVACGRRPVEPRAAEDEVLLVDWVLACWSRGEILEAADPRLGGAYVTEEMEMVLKLGLLCCDPLPAARPGIRRAVQILCGDVPLPKFSSNYLNSSVMALLENEVFGGVSLEEYPVNSDTVSFLSASRH
ncbi:hypothetical protein Taro_055923 [Colocasia esculenta]|uniref:non-specific serine/threonine protein kinase n=1 Tax=Colocasia esculenta TaxID=4460 RepID=A0A843XSK3_COLES|nr:hypothetical protein [Colocasia esculenta]